MNWYVIITAAVSHPFKGHETAGFVKETLLNDLLRALSAKEQNPYQLIWRITWVIFNFYS